MSAVRSIALAISSVRLSGVWPRAAEMRWKFPRFVTGPGRELRKLLNLTDSQSSTSSAAKKHTCPFPENAASIALAMARRVLPVPRAAPTVVRP